MTTPSLSATRPARQSASAVRARSTLLRSFRGDPALALREQASHLREEVGCGSALPSKGVDPLESLEHLPGLVHASKLEGKNARVCHEVCRGFRQSRQ